MRRLVSVVTAGAVMAMLLACGETGPVASGGDVDGAWELTEGTGAGGRLTLIEGYSVTLSIDGQQVSGTSACNHYGATVNRDGDAVHIGAIEHTEMGCAAEVMDVETMYLAALADIDAVNRSGDVLTLSGPATELRFVLVPPIPTADIVDTDWALESLLDGETASSASGEAVLRLDADGTFTASTGCRDLTGQYVEDDGQIELTEFAAEGDCMEEYLRAQDEHVDTVIGGGFRMSVEEDVLTVTTRGGELGLVYRAG